MLLNRKVFIKTASAAVAGLAGTASGSEQLKRYRSVKFEMIPLKGSVFEKCHLALKAGFNALEVNSQGYNRKEMLLASQTTGLKIVSVYNSHNWDRNLSALDEGERREAVRAVEESLTTADFYDAEYVQLLPGVVSNEHPEESKKSLLKSLQEISASLNHSKVKILLQNFPSHFYNEAGFFKNLLSSLSSAKFGICLNTETGLAKRELSDWIELLQKYPSKIDFQSNSDPCMKLLTESLDETGCISLSST